jgi:CheY-like chemotaxis protein
MRILVLDDNPSRIALFKEKLIGAAVTCTKHIEECITLLDKDGPYDYVFLDHDLDGKIYVDPGPSTGYRAALWLHHNPEKRPKQVIIHTCNEHAGPLMEQLIPNSKWLPAVFMVDFKLSDINNIEEIYMQFLKNTDATLI